MATKTEQPFRFKWEQALRETAGMSAALKGVLFTVATYADIDGTGIWASMSGLAERNGWHRSTVTRNVSEGVRLGWLVLVEDRSTQGKPSTYRLAIPEGGAALVQPPTEGGAALVHGGCRSDANPLSLSCTGGDALVPHNQHKTNTTTNPSTSPEQAEQRLAELVQRQERAARREGWDLTREEVEELDSLTETLAVFAPAFD